MKQNESSYLGGIVAAGMSKSGAIGAIGGVENPVIKDFITGYVDGTKSFNPDIKVSTGWVGDLEQYREDERDLQYPECQRGR